MSTPIEPSEIRKGDLIRWEPTDPPKFGSLRATEYQADADRLTWHPTGQHYLLDRPTPPVVLPTEPTLGTLYWRDRQAVKGQHETALWALTHDGARAVSESTSVPMDMVTEFVPILTHAEDETAVPTEALDRLRRNAKCANVAIFLAVVDRANGDDHG